MNPLFLIPPTLLFSLGCAGAMALLFLYRCLNDRLTRNLLFVFLLLILLTGRTLLFLFLSLLGMGTPFPVIADGLVTALGMGLLYFFLYRVVVEMGGSKRAMLLSTLGILAVQLLRLLSYGAGWDVAVVGNYLFTIAVISAYLFFVGFQFRRSVKKSWHPALQQLISAMGRVTLIFAPLSAGGYGLLYLLRLSGKVPSFDFLFLGLWGLISIHTVLVHFKGLTRATRKEADGTADSGFIQRYGLTPREAEVLPLILEGYTNRQIGDALFISFTTARTHVSHIFEKTGVKNRMELMAKVASE